MRRRKATSLAALALVLGAGCGDGGQVDALNAELDTVRTELGAAQVELERLGGVEAGLEDVGGRLSESQTENGELTRQRDDALASVREAEERASEAEGRASDLLEQMDDLRASFDPELEAARADFLGTVEDRLCDLQSENSDTAIDVVHATTGLINAEPPSAAAFEGFDLETVFDFGALEGAAEACRTQATLTAARGDGFYTVGDEIAPGAWRSTGTGDGCYWERLDADQDILDNHFGDAGGTVTIRSSDYEVHFDDCGAWEYLGP